MSKDDLGKAAFDQYRGKLLSHRVGFSPLVIAELPLVIGRAKNTIMWSARSLRRMQLRQSGAVSVLDISPARLQGLSKELVMVLRDNKPMFPE